MNTTLYKQEIGEFCDDLSWLEGKTLLLSGATGMIGSYLVDVVMAKCHTTKIIALGRTQEKAQKRFAEYWDTHRFSFCQINLSESLAIDVPVDYVIHAASNTHPLAYSTDPIGTITANVIGLDNLLNYASNHQCKCFAFLSSVEVYGENRGDVDSFSEDYCGYINCNTLRAGYPESKRTGEALCQAYRKQRGLKVVIPRLSRVFGPTLLSSDTKALSQFLHKASHKEDIVLKSAGTQFFSYAYVSDAVSGILVCLSKGEDGEAYNIAGKDCDICLKDLAQAIADIAGVKVVFDFPAEIEKAGYSTATKAVLNCTKISLLGWFPKYILQEGIQKTLDIWSN